VVVERFRKIRSRHASGLGQSRIDVLDPQMERLAEILGSLYFLNPLCKPGGTDWRAQLADLVRLDQPDEDRQQRLYGAFNNGFSAYSRLYRTCTPSASEALARLLIEAEATARDIHARYAE